MEYCATAQVHSFQPRKKLVLRIALEDSDGKKLAGLPYELDGGILKGKTDTSGVLEQFIPIDAEIGSLRTDHYEWPLQIAHLNPTDEAPDKDISGIQARLSNLGYDRGRLTGFWVH